jgi:hypothetical protein
MLLQRFRGLKVSECFKGLGSTHCFKTFEGLTSVILFQNLDEQAYCTIKNTKVSFVEKFIHEKSSKLQNIYLTTKKK